MTIERKYNNEREKTMMIERKYHNNKREGRQ